MVDWKKIQFSCDINLKNFLYSSYYFTEKICTECFLHRMGIYE